MDPGRFVTQHQSQFFIIGFHDEERSEAAVDEEDQDEEEEEEEEEEVHPPGGAEGSGGASASRSHPMRLSFGSMNGAMRNTLSPVREQVDSGSSNGAASALEPPEIRVRFFGKLFRLNMCVLW